MLANSCEYNNTGCVYVEGTRDPFILELMPADMSKYALICFVVSEVVQMLPGLN